MKINNRSRTAQRRQANHHAKNTKDDDNCSVICYKDSKDAHVGVVRIRQQIKCSVCNVTRGTLMSYAKHLIDNHHREKVKKQCEENRFMPTIYDQAIHLGLHNNFHYQSENFHFRYKNINEEMNGSSLPSTQSTEKKVDKFDNNQDASKNGKKRRCLEVILVFQNKTYSKIGTANAQTREELLQEMLKDRAEDLAKMQLDVYFTRKRILPDDKHPQGQANSAISYLVKEQSQVMLKNQQSQLQESFENGSSSAQMSNEETGVEQNPTAMTTDQIMTAKSLDDTEQPLVADDVMNICKELINRILTDVYSNTNELKREQQFLSGIARRSFKKKNTFICDLCSTFLTSEKYCSQHLNSKEHLDKLVRYKTDFLPWRRAMQEAIFHNTNLKQIMSSQMYDDYKATMALYLAPNSLSNRGRFCCAYCEMMFPDQWALEKARLPLAWIDAHLHSDNHHNKSKVSDTINHKELVVRFANVATVPPIFKLNGITQVSEIPDDIKNRYQWHPVTVNQLNDETKEFLRLYPYDSFEGTSCLVSNKTAKKQQKPVVQNTGRPSRSNANKGKYHGGSLHSRSGLLHTPMMARHSSMKRPLHQSEPINKRCRTDLNHSFSETHHYSSLMDNYERQPYHDNNQWTSRPNFNQQQYPEFLDRSNGELRSIASNPGSFYDDRCSPMVPSRSNYQQELPTMRFNDDMRNYNPRPINFNSQTNRSYGKSLPSLIDPPYHMNSQMNHDNNRLYSNASRPSLMASMNRPNSSPYDRHAGNQYNNHSNSSFPPPNGYPQSNGVYSNNSSMHSFADYRGSAGASTAHASMYSNHSMNPVTRSFDEFPSSNFNRNNPNSYGHPGAVFSDRFEANIDHFGHQNPPARPPWNPSPPANGTNPVRAGAAHFQPLNKPAGPMFSYSSSRDYHSNNTMMRGLGPARNFLHRP